MVKISSWSNIDIQQLKVFYATGHEVSEISKALDRTEGSIRNKAWRLGITNPKDYSDEEIQYIKDNYNSYNLREIAKHIGREGNYQNVCRKARELGLDRTAKKKESTDHFKDESGHWHKNGWIRRTAEQKANKISTSMKEWHASNEHPKGMTGKTHTEKYKGELSKRVKKYWQVVTPEQLEVRRVKMVMTKIANDTLSPQKNQKNPYSRARGGKRADLNNIYFRSGWEANMARYYNFAGIKWVFEPKTFYFKDIKRGCVSYTPDFYLPDDDRWVEVKGWMDDKSKTKLKRFAKYFPDEYKKLEVITKSEYKEFEKWSKLIPGWE